MKDEHELELLIASRFPIIAIETQEEAARARAAAPLRARAASCRSARWSVTNGLEGGASAACRSATTQDPAAALRAIARRARPASTCWLDFHPFLGNPLHVRLLKEIASDYERVAAHAGAAGPRSRHPAGDREADRALRAVAAGRGRDPRRSSRTRSPTWQRRNGGAELQGRARRLRSACCATCAACTEVDVRRLVRHAFEDDGVHRQRRPAAAHHAEARDPRAATACCRSRSKPRASPTSPGSRR